MKEFEDFTKEEIDLGDRAYIETQAHIKQVVNDYLNKDEITQCFWEAVRDGVNMYLSENHMDTVKEIAEKVGEHLAERIEDRIGLTVEVKVKK